MNPSHDPPEATPAEINSAEVTRLHEVACLAARVGGATLMHYRGRFETREKGPADLVTDADHAAQHAIERLLAEQRPEDAFIGEESPSDERPGEDRVCWIVDPLDGTTNYVHGLPAYATSVAAVRGRQLLAGAIYDPNRDELFAAGAGQGATLNAAPIRVTDCVSPGEALVAVSLPATYRAESPDLDDLVWAVRTTQAVRRSGSAALNLAYVACGRLDAHWAYHIHPWDSAAGALLLREAGGVLTGRGGAEFDVWQGHYVVAATSELHAAITTGLKPLGA